MPKTSKAWTIMPGGRNNCLYGEGFYISYNPGNFDIAMFASDAGAETAICKEGKFYILNGDFRDEYEELIEKGFDACISFFLSNLDKVSSWSNEYELKVKTLGKENK